MFQLDIIIPIAPYEFIDDKVLSAIIQLGIPHILQIQESESKEVCPSKMDRIINTRNQLRLKTTSDIVLCMDSDVILKPELVHQSLKKIRMTPYLGMLGIPTHLSATTNPIGHVKIKCALVRGDLLRSIPFQWDFLHCECLHFAKSLKYKGYQTRYLDTEQICEVINNEKNTKTSSSSNY